MENMIGNNGRIFFATHFDMDGNPVERTPDQYHYSYDPYVLWKSKEYVKGESETVYSDRLRQWNYVKFIESFRQVWHNEDQYFTNKKPKDVEKFLSLYFNRNICLTGIMQGCNYSSGDQYWIFYFKKVDWE